MPRPKIPAPIQDQILSECRRRCALCFALNNDVSAKVHGQIAHINRNPAHNQPENLAYSCLEHANLYDAVSRQSKAFTPGELRIYKANLLLVLAAAHDPHHVERAVAEMYRKLAGEIAAEELAEATRPKLPQRD